MDKAFALGALLLSALGAAVDVRSARIPNWLTGSGLAAALFCRAYWMGWDGLTTALVGAVLSGAFLVLPFLARGIGGGDVKLMASVGAWVGTPHTLALILATAIAGGIWAVAYVAFNKRIGVTMWKTIQLVRFHLVSGIRSHSESGVPSDDSIRFPYSLAIVSGAVVVVISVAFNVGR